MKIAIASSGLGHVCRGMEAWAESLAEELDAKGIDVTLFRGAGPKTKPYEVILPTFKRNHLPAKLIALLTSKGGWRIGLGAPHAVESFFYGLQLVSHLKRRYDLVHLQQGSLAQFLLKMEKLGLLKIPFIFANGQKAAPDILNKFSYLQFLSSFDKNEYPNNNISGQFVIPNFVKTDIYCPGDKQKSRLKLGLPADSLILLSVGLIDKSVKRMDYFIRETHDFLKNSDKKIKVVIAGSLCEESSGIIKLGKTLLGDNLIVFKNLDSELMPDLYRSADIFVLCSYREAFGLAIAEAMSCGLPVICHNFPIIQWVVGDGGQCLDLTHNGALMPILLTYCRDTDVREQRGSAGRQRIQEMFSTHIVIDQIIEMYRTVLFLQTKKNK